MVFRVCAEVVGEVVDALSKERDLHSGRARIFDATPVFGDGGGLIKSHDLVCAVAADAAGIR
jgi:hypothetical protein